MNSATTTLLLAALAIATIIPSSGSVVNALTASPQQGFDFLGDVAVEEQQKQDAALELESWVYYDEETDEWIPEDEDERDDDELDYYNNDEYWTPEQIEQMENLYDKYRQVLVENFGADWKEQMELEGIDIEVEDMEVVYERYLEFQEERKTEQQQQQQDLEQQQQQQQEQHQYEEVKEGREQDCRQALRQKATSTTTTTTTKP